MLKSFLAAIRNLFAPTVDSLLNDVQTRVKQLHNVADRKANEAAAHFAQADALEALGDAAAAESIRATNVAAKFQGLLG
jgi:hypothetical protein